MKNRSTVSVTVIQINPEEYLCSSWRRPGLWDSVAPNAMFKTSCLRAQTPESVNQNPKGGAWEPMGIEFLISSPNGKATSTMD